MAAYRAAIPSARAASARRVKRHLYAERRHDAEQAGQVEIAFSRQGFLRNIVRSLRAL
ncbi:hypothetical protein [Novacetimonas hansenii]|uniref:hypothetical protein n=1 Tax=Novacetimonas hansenii TaxID=436 RepID=UPI0023DD30FD|nr:hypothetical protein [Novacetimonas hansenii]WEQ60514.1 hypothetical protein LV563_14965 [Novacetimonas hansenii]